MARAEPNGLDMPGYIERILREQVVPEVRGEMSPSARAQAWRNSVRDLPHTPLLPDDAISRII